MPVRDGAKLSEEEPHPPQMNQSTPKSEANQAPEPTPLRVTPAAVAPVAPRSVAARL